MFKLSKHYTNLIINHGLAQNYWNIHVILLFKTLKHTIETRNIFLFWVGKVSSPCVCILCHVTLANT